MKPQTVGDHKSHRGENKGYLYDSIFHLIVSAMRFFILQKAREGEASKEEVLQSKVVLVDETKGKIENSHSIVLINYRGLNVGEVTELRAKYRETGVDYKVYKNATICRTFEELGHEEIGKFLRGPSAIAFGTEDPVSPVKITANFAKDHETLEIKANFMDGAVMDQKAIGDLVKLPSEEELIGKFLGGLNSPPQGMVNMMNGTLEGFVVALNAIAEKKKEEETA